MRMVAWELVLVIMTLGGLLAVVLQGCLRNIFERPAKVVRYSTKDLEDIKREAQDIRQSAGRINQRIRTIEEVATSRSSSAPPQGREQE